MYKDDLNAKNARLPDAQKDPKVHSHTVTDISVVCSLSGQ